MKLVNRLVTSLLLISLAICVALFGLAVLRANSLLLTFPYLTFSCTLVLSLFVLSILLKSIKEFLFRTVILGLIAVLPVVLHTFYFLNNSFLEVYGSFYLASLCVTISIGLAANLDLFHVEKRFLLIGLLLLTAALLLLVLLPYNPPILFTIYFCILALFSVVAIVFSFYKKGTSKS